MKALRSSGRVNDARVGARSEQLAGRTLNAVRRPLVDQACRKVIPKPEAFVQLAKQDDPSMEAELIEAALDAEGLLETRGEVGTVSVTHWMSG